MGDNRSVAALGPRALLEKRQPIDFDGSQIEPHCFVEMHPALGAVIL